jgi:hypothetical protein
VYITLSLRPRREYRQVTSYYHCTQACPIFLLSILAAAPSPPPRLKVTPIIILSGFPYCHEHHPKLASSVTQHVILLAITPETVFSHTLEAPGMWIADATRHVLDQDVFQPARALHARFHASFGSSCPTQSPLVSQDMSQHFQLPACQLVELCHLWYTFVARAFKFLELFLRLSAAAEVFLQRHAVLCSSFATNRILTDARSVGASTAVHDEAHWFVQITSPRFCLHSLNHVTHANPAISRVPASAPVGRTSQHIYLP